MDEMRVCAVRMACGQGQPRPSVFPGPRPCCGLVVPPISKVGALEHRELQQPEVLQSGETGSASGFCAVTLSRCHALHPSGLRAFCTLPFHFAWEEPETETKGVLFRVMSLPSKPTAQMSSSLVSVLCLALCGCQGHRDDWNTVPDLKLFLQGKGARCTGTSHSSEEGPRL